MKFIEKKFTGFEFPTLIIGKFGLQVIEDLVVFCKLPIGDTKYQSLLGILGEI